MIGSLGRPSERELPTHALAPGLVASRFQGAQRGFESRWGQTCATDKAYDSGSWLF